MCTAPTRSKNLAPSIVQSTIKYQKGGGKGGDSQKRTYIEGYTSSAISFCRGDGVENKMGKTKLENEK